MNRLSARRSPRVYASVFGVAGVAAVMAAATGAVAATATPASRAGSKPTVVLIHGAFSESAGWHGAVKRSQHEGRPVVTPANPLRGLTGDTHPAGAPTSVKGPGALAGYPYGGSVIAQATAHKKNARALVHIAAFCPGKSESTTELAGKFPGHALGPALNKAPFALENSKAGTGPSTGAGTFDDRSAADTPRRATALTAATQRPVAAPALDQKAAATSWKHIPSWNLITLDDTNIPAAAQRFTARQAHSHTVEIKTSHPVTVTHPVAVSHSDTASRLVERSSYATVR
ncbi:alpha/beta hydrolase [Streptomyces sp. NBC_00316]|uniref:alpha/beta hydrolase n=1 Tax=Streptomyces sp. NBC_00316 TaxID=2975710 RepID=UPI002E280310|nr:alpha/beta hydrolase [Streptomyces sp. NBC_00316]